MNIFFGGKIGINKPGYETWRDCYSIKKSLYLLWTCICYLGNSIVLVKYLNDQCPLSDSHIALLPGSIEIIYLVLNESYDPLRPLSILS
jgi:hypothetical protein